jgi:hypothetical protein
MTSIKHFTFATRNPGSDDAAANRIKTMLQELKQKYSHSLEKLLLPLTDADYKSQVSLADAKSKIGVAFLSDPESKKSGHKTSVSGVILCKLFTLTSGGINRLDIQDKWIAQLNSYYENLRTELGSEDEARYNAFFAEVAAMLKKAMGQIANKRALEDCRSIKGLVVISLMPDEMKKRFIIDFVDSYLQKESGKNQSEKNLAQFIVPQDPFPCLWKVPEGAEVEPVVDPTTHGQTTEVFDLPKKLEIDWQESAKERYFPAFGWTPDKNEEGDIEANQYLTIERDSEGTPKLDEMGNPIQAYELRSIYSLSRNQDYQKQTDAFDKNLKQYEEYARFDFVKNTIKREADQLPTRKEESFVNYYAKIAKQKFGRLIDVTQVGDRKVPILTLSGKAFYLLCSESPPWLQSLKDLATTVKKLEEAKRNQDKAGLELVQKEIVSIVKRKFLPPDIDEKTAIEFSTEIATVARIAENETNQEHLKTLQAGDYPQNVYNSKVHSKGILPSTNDIVTLGTTHNSEKIDIAINTKQNPFYIPKSWPKDVTKGNAPWPDGLQGLTRGLMTSWSRLPWSSLSLRDKKKNIEKMKSEWESSRDPKLKRDIDVVKNALFVDELEAYVKLNLAFNVNDSDSLSVVSKVENPPPLFHIRGESGPQAITLRDLLEEGTLKNAQDVYGKSYFDIATDAEANYGFRHKMPDFVEALMKQQLSSKQAFLIQKLLRVANSEEKFTIDKDAIFFDATGKHYSNLETLKRALTSRGIELPVKEKVACANLLVKATNDLIRKDNSLKRLIDVLEEELVGLEEEKKEQEVEREKKQPAKIPSDQDEKDSKDFPLPPIQFPSQPQPKKIEPKQEEFSLAASPVEKRVIQAFTKES